MHNKRQVKTIVKKVQGLDIFFITKFKLDHIFLVCFEIEKQKKNYLINTFIIKIK